MYEALHHVAVVVVDLERARRFYGGVLGLEELDSRPAFPFPGAWYALGADQLHLIVHDEAKTLRGASAIDSKDGHFAVRVRDASEVRARLEAAGWPFDDRPRSITGWHQLFTTDPDGNVLEFNSKIPSREEGDKNE
ncbi:VOC family protein [Paenibacillus sp.]|uniref:VOC family protein n=1 Tax=Paenibacillus sp. TaxID=58172 RepID=UPI002810A341|nr:VOC family protein [Paenibacillus sp.]